MNQANILILGFFRKNLGDDIFASMLINRFPDANFYVYVPHGKFFKPFNYKNVKKLIGKVPFDDDFSYIDVEKYDAIVYIGGSIFVESERDFEVKKAIKLLLKKCKKNKVPYFYISSNFGPYSSKEYLKLCDSILSLTTDTCFRDKTSYGLFDKNKKVRYCADLVFSLNFKAKKKKKNTIGISVIDVLAKRRTQFHSYAFDYYESLKRNIKYYISNGYTVYLFSFCKLQRDNFTIKVILSTIPKKYLKYIKVVNYNGNLNEFLNVYARMEYMVCTRFHSLVLSIIFKQKIYVLSYNQKLDNIIKDFNLNLNMSNITDLDNKTVIELEDFKEIDDDKVNQLKESGKHQFDALDSCLRKKFNITINDNRQIMKDEIIQKKLRKKRKKYRKKIKRIKKKINKVKKKINKVKKKINKKIKKFKKVNKKRIRKFIRKQKRRVRRIRNKILKKV